MPSDNYNLSKAGRQNVLSTAVRFAGTDVDAAPTAGSGVEIEMPPGVVVLRCKLIVITIDGGTAPTFNVGTVADEDAYGANLAISVVAGVDGAGALVGEYIAEATNIYVSKGTGTFDDASDCILALELIVDGRANEVYG